MWRRVRAAAAATLVLSAGMLAATPARAAGSGAGAPQVQLTQQFPHGYVEATLAPGQTFATTLNVIDSGTASATFFVTAVDGYTSTSTGVVYGNRAQALRDGPSGNGEYGAGTWITLSVDHVALGAGQSAPVQVSVTVPATATPGDWVGGVTVENPQPASQGGGSGPQLAITEASEMAVVVHVPGHTNAGVLDIAQPSLVNQGVQQFLDIPLRYTGDVLVKPVYSFTIRDSSGHIVYSHSGQFDTFVPHTSITYRLRMQPPLGPGTYTFVGSAGAPGALAQRVYTITVTGTPIPLPSSTPGGSSNHANSLLFLIGGPAAGTAVAGIGVVMIRRTRNRCSHCGHGRIGALLTVADFNELAHCRDCRRRALDRETVRLCPDCYRAHVIPGAELAPSTT